MSLKISSSSNIEGLGPPLYCYNLLLAYHPFSNTLNKYYKVHHSFQFSKPPSFSYPTNGLNILKAPEKVFNSNYWTMSWIVDHFQIMARIVDHFQIMARIVDHYQIMAWIADHLAIKHFSPIWINVKTSWGK